MVVAALGPNHQCRILTTQGPTPFEACAAPDRCNPASHGSYHFISFCVCGKVRRHSVNGDEIERSGWVEARPGERR